MNTSVGAWRKLERIRRNPRVALAFHTREYAASDRPEYILVQGTASLGGPVEDYPSTILDVWERFEPGPISIRSGSAGDVFTRCVPRSRSPSSGSSCGPTSDAAVLWRYRAPRCRRIRRAPQSEPRNGTAPRINHGRAAERASGLPHALLGWVGADGFPLTVPVEVAGSTSAGFC